MLPISGLFEYKKQASEDRLNRLYKALEQGHVEQIDVHVDLEGIEDGKLRALCEGSKTVNCNGVKVRVDSEQPGMGIPRHAHTGPRMEFSWDDTGRRHHPNKFPNGEVPNKYKAAVRQALDLPDNITLEGRVWLEDDNKLVVILESVS